MRWGESFDLAFVDAQFRFSRFPLMNSENVVSCLKRERAGLLASGLTGVSLFGSMARNEASARSDIDLAVTLNPAAKVDLFELAALSDQVSRLLGRKVDIVVEPTRNPRLQAEIDRDRVRVF